MNILNFYLKFIFLNIRALKKGELMINKNKENLVCDSWIESTLWNNKRM